MFWRIMDKIASAPGGLLYPLFRKIIEARFAKVNAMTDQKELFKIYKGRGPGWRTAFMKITDPELCEKIFYGSRYQKDFNEPITFYRRMHLICHLPASSEKQRNAR